MSLFKRVLLLLIDPYRTRSARIHYWGQTGKTAVATETILKMGKMVYVFM